MHGLALQAVASGLISALSWGTADFCGAKASKKLGGYHTAALICGLAALVYCLIFLVFLHSYAHIDRVAFAYAIAAGIVFACAMAAFYKGLELGPVSIVSPLGSLYPLATVLLLVTLFGNPLTLRQESGIGIVVAGASVAAGLFGHMTAGRRLSVGPLLGLVAAICWGVNFALLAQAINRIGWETATLVQQLCSAITFLFIWRLAASQERPLLLQLTKAQNGFLIAAALLQIIGFLSLTAGIGHVGRLASIAVAVSACYPVITVVLALRKLGERFELLPLLGALTSVAGIVLLSFG